MLEALEAQKKEWARRAKGGADALTALERSCRDALDQVRGSTRELCAGIPWAPASAAPPAPAPSQALPDAGPASENR